MLTKHIDIYCERLDPGLWAEPINAITNAAFIIAGFAALFLKPSGKDYILVALIFAMGIGSALFHTFATLWAMIADVLPILLYQISFIILYTLHVMKKSPKFLSLLLFGFIISMVVAMQLPREWLNGSLEYGPALLFVSGFAIWHYKNAFQEKFTLAAAALTFLVSLIFRSVDMSVCETFPLGTHFLWHCLNAVVLYLTARAYIKNVNTL